MDFVRRRGIQGLVAYRAGVSALVSAALIAATLVVASMPAQAEDSTTPDGAAGTVGTQSVASPAATLAIWPMIGPNAPLIGAVVTVRDRGGKLLTSGTSTAGGVVLLRDVNLGADDLPLTITTSGGVARNFSYTGALSTYAWPATSGTSTITLDLVTTAAMHKAILKRNTVPTQRSWGVAQTKIRSAMGIPTDAPSDLLRYANNYVGFDRIRAASRPERSKAPRSFNGLVRLLAKNAASGRPFNRVKPEGPVTPMGSAQFSATAQAAAVCQGNLPNSSGSGGQSTEIIEQVAVVSAGTLLEVAGIPSTLAAGLPGMLFGGLSSSGTSPELQAIEAVSQQLECISAQINALQTSVALQAAETCESAVSTAYNRYQNVVADAQSLVTDVAAQNGSRNLTLTGTVGYANILEGQTVVTGYGIGLQSIDATDAVGTAGQRNITVPVANDNIKIGMTVTGTGIGTTDDTPVTISSIVTDGLGNTVLNLTAPNTAAVSGVTISAPVRVTGKYESGGNTVLELTTEWINPSCSDCTKWAGSLTFTNPLDYDNAALTELMGTIDKITCNNIISKSIFESATGTSTPSVYNNLVADGIDNGTHTGQGNVQAIQQFLGAWSTVMYQQMALESERYNYLGDTATRINTMGIDEVTGKCETGATWLDATYCVYISNFTQATPPDLYSNELGLMHSAGNGSGIIAAPLGHMLPGMNPDLNNCRLDSLSDMKEGYQTAGLPVYWYFCQKQKQTDSYTISNFKDKQQDFFNAAQLIALNDDPNNSAVSTFYAPRVRHGDWPTGGDIKPIGDSGKVALRTLVVQEGLVLDSSTTSDSYSRFYGTSFYTNGSRSPADSYKKDTYPGDPYTLVDFKAELGSSSSFKVLDKNDLPDLIVDGTRYDKLGCPCMMQILNRPWWPQAVAGGISAWTATTVKPLDPSAAGF